MLRHEIKNKTFRIDNAEAKEYFNNEVVTYSNLTTTQSRLKKNKSNLTDLENRILKWIEMVLDKKRKEIYNKNESRRSVSGDNPHKDTHDKNNTTKPSRVGGPVYDSLMKESLEKEINEIKYLIEYMTNNNKNNLM